MASISETPDERLDDTQPPAATCPPWCQYDPGHLSADFPGDQYCSSVRVQVNANRMDWIEGDPQYMALYLTRSVGRATTVWLGYRDSSTGVELTPVEAGYLAAELLDYVAMARGGESP